ncbi:hypothetical protein STCU_09442 [Strigomonas culicis]|uniref:Uncharacterized protein n=1 Tax=Strigomonas culicis TaxID=28005 RepID=S9TMJ2_9TRYP|nr:hypothetical protein STCU_09442 [Strigomonas culicis]|eukprot:EPY19472.1 hypothetical protein STCU_09442 [Strigomonas culicis]
MVWTPYLIGDLYQRLQGPQGGSDPATVAGGAAERFAGERALLSGGGSGSAAGVPELRAYTDSVLSSSAALAALPRQEALARSHAWFRVFFEWMENMELVTEETVERYSVYRAEQRTQRIELQRQTRELRSAWAELEARVQYLHAKRRRMRELLEASGEGLEEAGGEEEEALRERALARLRWSIYDACHQLQLSARELDMLRAIQPEQRATISAQYQQTLDAVRRGELSLGRQTYTVLPGGGMVVGTPQHPQPVDADALARAGVCRARR